MAKQSEYVKRHATYTISEEALELLEELAMALGLSKSAVVELAIRKLWASEGSAIAAKLKRRGGQGK